MPPAHRHCCDIGPVLLSRPHPHGPPTRLRWTPLLKRRPLGAGRSLAECGKCREWNMIWMFPLKWKISHPACLRARKTRGVITHQFWCIWVNFYLYHRNPCRHSEVQSGVAHTGFCFPAWSWVRDERRRSGLPAETPQLEVKLTWVTDVKEISMMGITSCILHSVISPISAAWGDLHSQRIIGTPLVIRGWAQRRHNWLLKRFKSPSLQHTDQLQNKRQYSSRQSRGAWSQRTELTWLTYIQLKSQLPSRLSDASCPQKYGQIWLQHLLTAAFKSWFPQHTECHSTTCARIQQLKKGQAAATIYTVSISISIGTIWPPPLSVFPTLSPSSSSLHPADGLIHFFRCIW